MDGCFLERVDAEKRVEGEHVYEERLDEHRVVFWKVGAAHAFLGVRETHPGTGAGTVDEFGFEPADVAFVQVVGLRREDDDSLP